MIPAQICPQCGRTYSTGEWPYCPHGEARKENARIHPSEQVTYYENSSGEVVIPGRADQPIHPKYARDGYVVKRARTISEVKNLERKSGTIMVSRHYDNGSTTFEKATGTDV
jgi:hypothetical protein